MRQRMKTGSYAVYHRDGTPFEVWNLSSVREYRRAGLRVVSILTHLQNLNREIKQKGVDKDQNKD